MFTDTYFVITYLLRSPINIELSHGPFRHHHFTTQDVEEATGFRLHVRRENSVWTTTTTKYRFVSIVLTQQTNDFTIYIISCDHFFCFANNKYKKPKKIPTDQLKWNYFKATLKCNIIFFILHKYRNFSWGIFQWKILRKNLRNHIK